MRVYLPATLPTLRRWHADRVVGPAPLPGHAVTPALREWYAAGDLEELEYAAMADAARACLALLAADPAAVRRRVVVALDVPDGAVAAVDRDDLRSRSRSRVQVTAPAPWQRVAAVHVDEPTASEVVADAVAALPAADAGDDDARFTVDEADGLELQWWATQEVPDLLDQPS